MEQLVENKNCFICQNNFPLAEAISKIKAKEKVCFQFARLASRFLTADVLKTKNVCCDKCLPDLETFCEMFESFELLQLELFRLLEKISTKITSPSKTTDHHEDSNSSDFCLVVQKKRKCRAPRVYLEKLNNEHVRGLFNKPTDLDLGHIKHESSFNERDTDMSPGIMSPNSTTYMDESSENKTETANFDSFGVFKVDVDDRTQNLTKEPNDIEISVAGQILNGKFESNKHKGKRVSHRVKTKVIKNGLLQIKVDGNRHYSCSFCTYVNSDTRKIVNHLRRQHTLEKPFICRFENCHKELPVRHNLKRHVRTIHEKHKWDDKCDTCGKMFPFKHELMLHLMTKHEGIQPYKCETCGKAFATTQGKGLHQRVQHLNGPLLHCDKCPKTYKAKTRLAWHKNYEHGENAGGVGRFPCDVCKNVYSTKLRLRCHKRNAHCTYQKEHKCNWPGCTKTYLFKKQLNAHIRRVHTGTGTPRRQLFDCDHCRISFSRKDTLTRHILRIHSGKKKRLVCKGCGGGFSHSKNFQKHQKSCLKYNINKL